MPGCKRWGLWLTLVLLSGTVGALRAAPRYTVAVLGSLPGKTSTVAFGNHSINNAGQVVGHCNLGDLSSGLYGDWFSENVAFRWSKQSGIQALPLPPGAANASGYSLNDRGQIIGLAGSSYLDMQGVLWEGGTVHTFGPLSDDTTAYPQAINNRGQIAGVSALFVDETTLGRSRPVLWDKGQIHLLPMDGYSGGQANSINASGRIAGFLQTGDPADQLHAVPVVWDPHGTVQVLETLGGDFGFAWHLNDQGQVTGMASTAAGAIEMVLWAKGKILYRGSLGGAFACLWDINNQGQAVGEAYDPDGVDHAILVENGVMYDLNDLIPPGSGRVLTGAGGINERGQIVAGSIANGEFRTVLLTPKR